MRSEQDNRINKFFWLQLEKYGKLRMNLNTNLLRQPSSRKFWKAKIPNKKIMNVIHFEHYFNFTMMVSFIGVSSDND